MEEPVPLSDVIEHVLMHVLPPELARRRTELLTWYDKSVADLEERAVRVYGEVVLREVEILYEDGFPKEDCLTPAYNNTAFRKKEIQDEMISELARLQGELRKGIRRLLEDL